MFAESNPSASGVIGEIDTAMTPFNGESSIDHEVGQPEKGSEEESKAVD